MKYLETVSPKNFTHFLSVIDKLGQSQIYEYIREVYNLEGTKHHPMQLMKEVTLREEFSFLWSDNNLTFELLFNKVKQELAEGYFMGAETYVPYPEEITQVFAMPFNDFIIKKAMVRKMFEDDDLHRKFMTNRIKEIFS
jgi:hypothetical protein